MKKPRTPEAMSFQTIAQALFIQLILSYCMIGISSCVTNSESQEKPAVSGTEASSVDKSSQDMNELTVAFSSGTLEFDPRKSYSASEAQIFTALYEGLFTYHPLTLEPIPGVISSWELSEDKKLWTFSIRGDAYYWNGDPVLAKDFRDAWISLLNPTKDAPYSSLFDVIEGAQEYRLGQEADEKKIGIEARDDKTLIVRLKSPASFFPSMLCHHSFAPIHPSMLDIEDWSSTAPISNGPYCIVKREEDHISLARNELYWDVKRLSLEKIRLYFVSDETESASLWDSGKAQWIAANINLDLLEDRRGIVINPMFGTHYYYIKSAKEPWNKRQVRRALSLSLPWETLRKDHYIPAETLIFPVAGYPKPDGIGETRLEEAKQLLSEAGYPEGVGLPELIIRITPSQESRRIAELMASTWKSELGIPVKVEEQAFDDYYQSLKKNDYVVGSTTWIGDFADPYTFLQMWRRDSNLNDAKYNDPSFEDLIDRSMTLEGEERLKLLSEAEAELLQGGTILPISHIPAINIIDTDEVNGWFPNPLDIHPFKYLSIAAFRPLPGIVKLEKPKVSEKSQTLCGLNGRLHHGYAPSILSQL